MTTDGGRQTAESDTWRELYKAYQDETVQNV